MNISKQEFLSAWLDDEVGEFEQRRLIDELQKDQSLGDTLGRYALIGEAMRTQGKTSAYAKPDFLARLHDKLDEEEPVYADNVVSLTTRAKPVNAESAIPSKQKQLWQYGMAAAIAVVALGGTWALMQPSPTPEAVTTLASTESPVAVVATTTPATTSAPVALVASNDTLQPIRPSKQLDPHTRDILKQYVAQHVKYASTNSLVPSIRAVSYNDY